MDSDALFHESLVALERAFRRLEQRVQPPQLVRVPSGISLRYIEQSVEQALLQKLARQISGVHAVRTLLVAGLVQEQCVIQRTLDEIGEDIQFLAMAAVSGELSDLHERYLAEFWAEEYDRPTAISSSQKRGLVRRKSIRAYIARKSGLPDPSGMDAVGHTLHKAYSGYVHAASPHIMDMCGGDPPLYKLAGLHGTPRIEEHREDAWNYFYRALLAATMVAKAFGDAGLVAVMYDYIGRFENASGTSYLGSSDRPPDGGHQGRDGA